MRIRSRRAFVLLAVLWITAGVSVMVAALSMFVQEDGTIAQNHLDLERARWKAEGCSERALAAADAALAGAQLGDSVWIRLDAAISASPLVAGCTLEFEAGGERLDINSLDEPALERVFAVLGYPPANADSLASAILDWRDPDNEPRAMGAEQSWYVAHQRVAPRNRPFASAEEIRLVRGLEGERRIDSLFDTESERLLLSRARPELLLALDGMTTEAMAVIAAMESSGKRSIRLEEVVGALSPAARAEAMTHYSSLVQRTASLPERWEIMATQAEGQPAVSATVEMTVIASGQRARVTRYLTEK